MTTKILLLITIAISLTSAFAKIAKIPLAETIVKNQNEKNKSKYVLKNAKGTIVKSFFDINTPENWFNLSPATGAKVFSSELAYLSHGNPSSSDIIVAVIDSGVDVNHPDLQGNIWINQSEIPNNSLDDDKNGYTDDVFGWTFIGGAHGMGTVEKSDELANGLKLIKGNPIAQVESDTT